MGTSTQSRDLLPTLPEACEPISCVRLTARVVSPTGGTRRRMPTLIGVGSELWLELEQGVQGGAVASAEAHPQTPHSSRMALLDQQLATRRRPRTLREDQPRLAEAYRREAERILAREARTWGLGRDAPNNHTEKHTASACAFDGTQELAAE